MNAKQAKRLRALLRSQDIDPTECGYELINQHKVYSHDAFGRVNGVADAYTARLAPMSGRRIYQQMKKVA